MAIVTRAGKGSELTHAEMDTNFTDLRDNPTGLLMNNTKGVAGIKLDPLTPEYGWHDLIGMGFSDPMGVNNPTFATYVGGVKEFLFQVGNEMFVRFHMPHDHVPGSDIFLHVHWSHNSTLVTGGTATFALESTYSKGHNQAASTGSVITSIIQNASTTQRQHMIAETGLSTPGGSAGQLKTEDLEVDGMILARVYIDSNDMTVSSGSAPDIFIHFVDIHYRSTGIATKNKTPDFWT